MTLKLSLLVGCSEHQTTVRPATKGLPLVSSLGSRMEPTKAHFYKDDRQAKGRSQNAYKPRPPFRTVEGIESLAWEKLSCVAVWVLMEFYRKFDGHNRQNLSLTYREVKPKMANGTFSKALRELGGFGFIDVKRYGRLERYASLYALSHRWKKLSRQPERLDKIRKLLVRAEKVKRIPIPSHFSDPEKVEFRLRRRRIVNKLGERMRKP